MKIYIVFSEWREPAVFSTLEAANAYAANAKYGSYYVNVDSYEINARSEYVPRFIKVYGTIQHGEVTVLELEGDGKRQWTFRDGEYETNNFWGSVKVSSNETPSHFYERAKDVVLEKYKESLHG